MIRTSRFRSAFLTFAMWVLPSGTVSAGPGDLLWEGRYDQSPADQAFAVAATGGGVFVAGYVNVYRGGAYRGRDFVVRAHEPSTGKLLWQDQLDKGSDDFASGVVADGTRVFVSGTTFGPRRYDWIVRAYDAKTGQNLWEATFDLAGRDDFSRGTAVALEGGLLFVGGYAGNSRGNQDWIVRAYNTSSGALVWQDQFDFGGDSDGVRSLAIKDGRLFAGGVAHAPGGYGALVRAYNAASGAILWQERTTGTSPNTYAQKIVVEGDSVFIGLFLDELEISGKFAFAVQARQGANGMRLWDDRVEHGGELGAFFGDLAVHGGRLFAIGSGGPACNYGSPSNCDVFARSYSTMTGALLWERQFDLSGLFDEAQTVTAVGQTVFFSSVAGPVIEFEQFNMGKWRVHALNSATGQLRWSSGGSDVGLPLYNMAVLDGRLFIPGISLNPAGDNWDFTIRAYDAAVDSNPGDVNNDGLVDCNDIVIVRAAFGKRTAQPGFDSRADVVVDGVIDIRDLTFVSQRLLAGTTCK